MIGEEQDKLQKQISQLQQQNSELQRRISWQQSVRKSSCNA
ncbi:hypothetical protein [Psychrobacter sp. KH172YL61]|nr:hypothetical protein [Psychrobacter sp. KH172YL61]